MIFLFEIPIIAIVALVLGLLGINLVTIFIWGAVISLIISIIALFIAENKIIVLIMIAFNIGLLFFLDGKHLDLWDILTWLF